MGTGSDTGKNPPSPWKILQGIWPILCQNHDQLGADGGICDTKIGIFIKNKKIKFSHRQAKF